jgi:arginine decarboxylase
MKRSPITSNNSNNLADANQPWSPADSAALYCVEDWGNQYFGVTPQGNLAVKVPFNQSDVELPLMDIVAGMRERGVDMPCILRIENLLGHRLSILNQAFEKAIRESNYRNVYRGVFPIKVNQQSHVVDEISRFGQSHNHGLEAGSKAELIIALSHTQSLDSLIICNGYKDEEFVELGLYARKIGVRCFFVIESLAELPIILAVSQRLSIEPLLGVRIRLSTTVDGHWQQDSGDQSIFGLSTNALLTIVDQLKTADMLHCLQLLHCHLGSQIPNIRNIRVGVQEACRFYGGLVKEGADMGYLDLGGGLAVDYDGSRSNSTHSKNYGLNEYCVDIVETVMESLDPLDIPHPVIVTESGRATAAYSSLLLFNVLDVRHHRAAPIPESLLASAKQNTQETLSPINSLLHVCEHFADMRLQECYNDALFYREEVRELFKLGQASMRERGLAENLALSILNRIVSEMPKIDRIPTEIEDLPTLLADIYYGNFSLFQSLPDIWAIDQVFPIMPIHRLQEKPTNDAILADLTCDCDGKIDQFVGPNGLQPTLPLHELNEDEEYYLGVFLVGAYQETLGDLHNLFGDTNVVSVRIKEDQNFEFVHEFHGDTIGDVLEYVEYDVKNVQEKFRQLAEQAVRAKRISATDRREMLKAFKDSLQGYTYFEKSQ